MKAPIARHRLLGMEYHRLMWLMCVVRRMLVQRFIVLFIGCLILAWWLVILSVPLFCRS